MLNEEDALKKIKKVDKERSKYYKHYTNKLWGDKKNYELCIDTSVIEVEKQLIY